MKDEVTGPSKNMLRFAGRQLTIVNRTEPVQDERYRDLDWTSEDVTETFGEVAERGTPSFERRADSVDSDVDLFVWVPDDVNVTSGEDEQEVPATFIEDGDYTYRVYETFHEDNGIIRCHCVKQ